MDEKSLKPQLRFKGFSDAWEQRKLGKTVSFYNGLTYSPNNIVQNPGTLVLRSSNVKDGEISLEDNVYVDSKVVNSENVQKGDIIVVVRNGSKALIGKHAKIKRNMGNTVIGAFMTGVRYHNSDFLNSLLNTEKFNSEINKDLGATINQITTGSFKEMEFKFPIQNSEQQKIGTFFSNLDNLITLHQRKLDKLGNMKKALLEKMFPKNDSNVPEIRFKGFSDAWEQRKLEDVANRYDNLRIPVAASERISGETPYYGANGIQDYVQGYTHDGEFVLVAEDGANDLKNYPVQYVSGKIWVNNHAHVLQGKNSNDNKFLKYNISQTNIEPFLVGGGRAKLNAEVMMKIEVSSPKNTSEQQKIGTFFSNLDNLITLHQRKLEKLKNIKKSCLEKMFV